MRLSVVFVPAALMAIVIGAAPANADPNPDASFLAALDGAGISYGSGPQAIAAGRQVCQWIDAGQKRSDVIKTVQSGNPGFTMSGAADFTTLAERAYCPGGHAAPSPAPAPAWQPPIEFPIITPGAG